MHRSSCAADKLTLALIIIIMHIVLLLDSAQEDSKLFCMSREQAGGLGPGGGDSVNHTPFSNLRCKNASRSRRRRKGNEGDILKRRGDSQQGDVQKGHIVESVRSTTPRPWLIFFQTQDSSRTHTIAHAAQIQGAER